MNIVKNIKAETTLLVLTFLASMFLFYSLGYARQFEPGSFVGVKISWANRSGFISPDGNVFVKSERVNTHLERVFLFEREMNTLIYSFEYDPQFTMWGNVYEYGYAVGFGASGSIAHMEIVGVAPKPSKEFVVNLKTGSKTYQISYDPVEESVYWYYSRDGHIILSNFRRRLPYSSSITFVDADTGGIIGAISIYNLESYTAAISQDGKRIEGKVGSNSYSFNLPTGSIPNDPDPPMPPVTVIPEGIIDGISASGAFISLTSLANQVLSNIIQPTTFPTIKYAVRVIGADKRPILGLSAGNFQVNENTAFQSPITVQSQGAEVPVSIALCLDTSGSISDSELTQINSTANKFIDLFGSSDRGAIFKFSTNVRLIQGFTSDKGSLKNAINSSPPERNVTSLYDSIYDAVSLTRQESNRKAVVALTDGYDNDSSHTLQQIIDYSLENKIPVFTIGLGNPLNVALLQKIANDCRGIYFNAVTTDKLEEVFNKIAENIRSRYIITYVTNNPTKDGTIRTVETTATSGGNSASATFQYRAPQGQKPVAQIVSITPNPAVFREPVTFAGIGTDSDGTIVGYSWRSNIDGVIGSQDTFQTSSLSQGNHAIYFKVRDNDGAWSEEVTKTLRVSTDTTPDNTHGRQKHDNSVGEPINITTGNMYTSPQKDIFIPGKGLPFNFYRTYNSQKNYDGPIGYGWTHSYNITLTEYADSLVKIMDENGTGLYFMPNGSGIFTPPKGEHSSLLKNPDGTFKWTRKYKLLYDFDTSGRLTKMTDRNGNHIDLAYDGTSGLLSTITDTAGRQIIFGYQNNRIETITGPVKTITYTYDTYGNLKTVTYPVDDTRQEQRTYNYTDSNGVHNLTEIIDETGTSTYFVYDSQDRAYENCTGADYNKIHLDFYPSEQKTVETRYRDSVPYQYTYYYDADGMITSITDPKGYVTLYHYDSDLNRTEILLSDTANGYYLKAKMTFDINGNMTNALKGKVSDPNTDPTGTPVTFTYHPTFDFLTSVTDELGRRANYEYDPNTGDLLETYKNTTQNPSMKYASTLYTYFATSLVETVTDPNGNVTTYTYDVQGNLTSVDPPLLPPTTYDLYDAVGNLKQTTAPGETANRITTFNYDKRARLISKVYPPAKAGDPALSEIFVYDGLGYLLSHTDTAGNVITNEYNDMGLLKKTTKTLRLEGGGERQLITENFYDSVGNLKKITDPTSHSIYYEYDELNRVSRMIDEAGNITDFTYYPDGSIKTKTDPKVNLIEYYYDAKNRLETITYPDDSSKVYTYYDNGLVHTITNSEGTMTYTYDDYNRVASVDGVLDNDTIIYTYYAGNQIESVTSPAGTVNYDIDELNRTRTITGYDGLPINYTYYANSGNLNSITYPNNTLAVHNYDNLDRIIDIINKTTSENIISSYNYEYNDAGLRQKVTFKDSSFNSYGYDSIYRLTSENKTSPSPYSINYNLDDIGNRNQIDKGQGAITYAHNLINQTESLNNPSSPKGNKVRIQGSVLDENIDRVEVNGVLATINGTTFTADVPLNAGDNPVTAIAYDKAGNSTPISISLTLDTASTSRFAYDANGNMIQRTELGKTTLYGYDYDNRLMSVKDGNNNIIKYRYDPLGRRIAKEVNGNTTYFIHEGERVIQERDEANIVNYLYGPGIDDILVMYKGSTAYYYHKDALGSITGITSSSGSTVESYSYDAFGNLLTPVSSIGNRYYFTGRELDSETGLYYYRNRYYDSSLGRFITQDPIGIADDINLYAYCFNNPVNFIDPWGLGKEGKGNSWDWLWSNILEPPYNTLTQPGYNYGEWTVKQNLRNLYGASLDSIWLASGIYGAWQALTYVSPSYYRYIGTGSRVGSGWVTRGYQPPYSTTEAMDKLSAPIEWGSVQKVDVPFSQYVSGPRPAAPQFGRTGFGSEYKIGGFGDWGNYFKAWGKYIVDMVTGR